MIAFQVDNFSHLMSAACYMPAENSERAICVFGSPLNGQSQCGATGSDKKNGKNVVLHLYANSISISNSGILRMLSDDMSVHLDQLIKQ